MHVDVAAAPSSRFVELCSTTARLKPCPFKQPYASEVLAQNAIVENGRWTRYNVAYNDIWLLVVAQPSFPFRLPIVLLPFLNETFR
jgi:hypothetical protein